MMLDDPFGDRQSQAGTAGFSRPRFIRAVKTVKNAGDILRGNTYPVILHLNLDVTIFFRYFEPDFSPGRCVFNAVVHEDTNGLFEQLLVRLYISGTLQLGFKGMGRIDEAGFADRKSVV